MTAIFLSAFAPGPKGGAQLVSQAFLQAVCTIHRGDVIYVGPEPVESIQIPHGIKESIHVPDRPTWSKVFGLLKLRFDRFSPFVEHNVKRFSCENNIFYINGETLGRFAKHKQYSDAFKVVLFHNHYRTYCKYQGNNLSRRLLHQLIERNVFSAYHSADLRLFLTNEDRRRYDSQFGRPDLNKASIGRAYFGPIDDASELLKRSSDPTHAQGTSTKIVLVNMSLGAPQNESGVVRLLTEIWPKVAQRDSDVKLVLAGGVPTKAIAALAANAKRVDVIKNPTDAQMEELWSEAPVVVSTNEHGSGIKVRVGEALRYGATVVSTPHSAIGYECINDKALKVFRSPEEACDKILESLAVAGSVEQRRLCRKEYESSFSFEQGLKILSDSLMEFGAPVNNLEPLATSPHSTRRFSQIVDEPR